jgi:hypothetical protein
MNRFHPNSNRAATCALVAAVIAVCGCKSSSSGIANNPFFAPDRVAPPSTRVIGPGQAQPYYQGDPLPVMQSSTSPPADAVVTASNPAEALSSSGRSLAWNTPGGAAPQAKAASPWDNSPSPVTITRGANEPAVSVPMDSDSLRFALPTPTNPEPAAPIASAPIPTSPQPSPPSAAPRSRPNQGVQLASFNAPAANAPSPSVTEPMIPSTPQLVTSPWRTPSRPTPSPAAYGLQPLPVQQATARVAAQPQQYTIPAVPQNLYLAAQPQYTGPANAMAVQLRAVSSPPQPGDPMPRIRVPGYDVPQTAATDGFRPRSSMR